MPNVDSPWHFSPPVNSLAAAGEAPAARQLSSGATADCTQLGLGVKHRRAVVSPDERAVSVEASLFSRRKQPRTSESTSGCVQEARCAHRRGRVYTVWRVTCARLLSSSSWFVPKLFLRRIPDSRRAQPARRMRQKMYLDMLW